MRRAAPRAIETLEGRLLLANVLTVNTLLDTDAVDPTNANFLVAAQDAAGNISLRSAIQSYNAHRDPVDWVINFDLGAGTPSIAVDNPLPFLQFPTNTFDQEGTLLIDGNTGGSTRVEIDGTNAGDDAVGLQIVGGNTTIASMVINRFDGDGIVIGGSPPPGDGNNRIRNCYIGTNAAGDADLGNGGNGILIAGGTFDNYIGGIVVTDRNVISGNAGDGIHIEARNPFGPNPEPTDEGNLITHNYIGLSASGNTDLGNDGDGIEIQGDPDAATQKSRPNQIGNAIGGGNVISGNAGDGILIQGFFFDGVATAGNIIHGNLIGLAANGAAGVGNDLNGVHIVGSPNNQIGGIGAAGNVISDNDGSGVLISLEDSKFNNVQGNAIGTNSNGDVDIGNSLDGVQVALGASENLVGGFVAGEGNLISGNDRAGVQLFDAHTNRVQENTIGQNRDRSGPLGNSANGVLVDDGVDNTIRANAIAGNTGRGVHATNGSVNTEILFNFIGSASSPNSQEGVLVDNNSDTSEVSSNSIGNNGGHGVHLSGVTGSLVTANGITGNNGNGVQLTGATLNFVGGLGAVARNVVGGNFGHGVSISGGFGNRVENNFIGTDATGMIASPNGVPASPKNGVNISDSANNIVFDNVISGNTGAGVRVTGASATGNNLRGNIIGGNVAQSAALSNGSLGIDLGGAGVTGNDAAGDLDTGPNNLQNFPMLTSAQTDAGVTTILGSLTSAGSTTYVLEFFANFGPNSGGIVEGQRFIGSTTVTTDPGGVAAINFNPATPVPAAQFITATATSPDVTPNPVPDPTPDTDPDPADTSEFSAAVVVTAPGGGNIAPTLGAIGDKTVNEGSAVTFTALASDPDAGDTLAFSLDAGAPAGASIDPTTGEFTFTPADGPGTFSVTVRVTDNGSPALNDFEAIDITVSNVAPTIALGGSASSTVGAVYTLNLGTVADPGVDTVSQFIVHWDDGSAPETFTAGGDVTHVFSSTGIRNVTVDLVDEDGTHIDAGTKNVNVTDVAAPFSAKINFQPAGATVPTGYVADTGLIFGTRGGGLSYGWDVDNSSSTRDRNSKFSINQAFDTLTHTQRFGARTWEIAVPNGTYVVHLVSGDAHYFNSTYRLNVEDVLAINGVPADKHRFVHGTALVTVTDGRLTLSNAAGSDNNKINFIEITSAPASAVGRINFQLGGAPVPAGFVADTGLIFGDRGNGLTYGWDADNTATTRDRNDPLSPNQAYDTLAHMQKTTPRTWELAVPNGTYLVHLVAGDPSFLDSTYRISIEGAVAIDASPNYTLRWLETLVSVTVTDGRLTITSAAGAVNNKLTYVEVF